MSDLHQHHAARLDRALSEGMVERHSSDLDPLLEVSDALRRDAEHPSELLDPTTAKNQRIVLMNMAHAKTPSVSDAPVTVPAPARPWKSWLGVVSTAVAVVLLAALVVNQLGPNPLVPSDLSNQGIARILIPEAHAADAFTLVAESQDANGASADTTFKVTSKVDISATELEQTLRLIPALAVAGETPSAVKVAVEQTGTGEFRVRPAVVLDEGKVYRISLAAAVQQGDGSSTPRDFSWAIQTKEVFRVTSSIPAPESAGVPVNTGIEFTMSLEGWEDPAASFTLEPSVKGRLEAHGRSLSFVPEQPLEAGRLYTATLKKGLKLKGSALTLPEDYVIRFETQPKSTVQVPQEKRLFLFGDRYETSPGREFVLRLEQQNAQDVEIAVTGFSLNDAQAKAFLTEHQQTPSFAEETQTKLFEKYATSKSFELSSKLDLPQPDGRTYLPLPKIAAGRFIVKLQPQGGTPVWLYLESTNVATYTVADKDTLMIWAMNIDTQRPLTDLPVAYGSVNAKTDASGLARLPTPLALSSTSTPFEIVTLGSGEMSSILLVTTNGSSRYAYYYGYGEGRSNDQTVAYLYADRPIYRTTDRAELYGLVQDRLAKTPGENLSVQLTRSGFYGFGIDRTDREKVYRRAEVVADEAGIFKTSLEWSTLAPGYYSLAVKRGERLVGTRYIEIRDFTKPAYSLEVTTTKSAIFAGEDIQGEVRATFFDGTPVSNLEVDLGAELVGVAATQTQLALKTDQDGRATFTVKTNLPPGCDLSASAWCPSERSGSLLAIPHESEEAQISGNAFVRIFSSRALLDIETAVTGTQALVTFRAHHVDLTKLEGAKSWDARGEPLRSTKIVGKIFERSWKSIQTGTGYNYLEKTTYPIYRYEVDLKEVATLDLTTDAAGRATFPLTMQSKRSYTVVALVKDERGAEAQTRAWLAESWYNPWASSGWMDEQGIVFDQTDVPQDAYRGRHLGERVSMQLFKNDEPMPNFETPRILYVQSRLGLGATTVTNKTGYEFVFGQEHVPNVAVRAIVFMNGRFIERYLNLGLEVQDQKLTIDVQTDKPNYAPGSKANLRVRVTHPQGQPVKDARVAVSLVDEAVFAVPGVWDSEEDPLSYLYTWVNDGIILMRASHLPPGESDGFGGGGAEKGGGGGDTVRRNFKDTAAFYVVRTDEKGEGTIEASLPDNLTSWRVTTVAMTSDLFAGSSKSKLVVTKPIFVDVVAPSVLLTKDKPVLKLRAYGAGLSGVKNLTYVVDAPSLGITKQSVAGTLNEATYVAVDSLPEGEHALVIRVTSDKGTDAIEKKIRIVSSRFLRDDMIETELAPGVALPDPGSSREIEVSFVPKTRAQYLRRLRNLASTWSQRVESQYANRVARQLLREALHEDVSSADESLLRYQKASGGIAILPYASEDVELTSKFAAIDTSKVFDHTLMAQYLWDVVQRKDVSREEAIRAVSGLAALGHPMLTTLNRYGAEKDLSWREQLAIIRGLEAVGDREAALVRLETFLAKAEDQNGQMFVRVSDNRREIAEATAEAASYAALLVHPSAPKLNAWLEKNWAEDALTDLDRITYLARVVPLAVGRDVSLSYTIGGGEQKIELKDGRTMRKRFTADEIKAFRITQVDAPAVAVMTREVTSLPTVSPDIALTRRYERPNGQGLDTIAESDLVMVELQAEFSPTAPAGCYVVRDHLPAGLAPVVHLSFSAYDSGRVWYPSGVDDNAVSFVVCRKAAEKQERESILVRYRARVVSRGTYHGEPAVLQSMNAPSVSALSTETSLIIK